jgi:hypothetical protein
MIETQKREEQARAKAKSTKTKRLKTLVKVNLRELNDEIQVVQNLKRLAKVRFRYLS